ncbi:tRNA (guanosine(46)-N7)-methyltransferase TrmB [Sansalvadorimonas sp. 2012CJ34-2]|uniref:tRNA (guanine-N(7)-)-methyltransferase n=1 Tax=Parendozoicomonas callyspongiae TaxID=2942213 RepID=A0ABT0PAJ1_9GAMM|nr:tRNA (guanosine(46)-N7)-methyltransferase TrmB [Sansalvadorimonas sp. 2012CJ34-2]MCL6268379.1 tRNA (guanosine(46)-N7)-methyltransferase TrmB [Sansalvadorimonas sp. 2012CJ34-2]
MTDTDTQHHRKIKSFVLRAGRMTTGQQRGWDVIFPHQGLKLENGALDIENTFGRKAPLVVEIGFGMGLSLVEMAGNELDKDFIGIEVHRPGVGSLMNEADKAGLSNLRAYCDDAVEVLRQCIPDNSISRMQVYFPDPWHKKRHNKRRLIQPEFVASILPKMKPGGVLHLATDWENYAEQMMEVMSAAEGWENQAGENQYAPRPDFRPLTKFEKRGQRLGHGVWDLLFEKK